MGSRTATVYVDYQQRAKEFSVGDLAYPLAGSATDESQAGTVVAVYPGIGQVDIEFPWGSGRYPVEDVQRVSDVAAKPPDPEHTTVPGGAGTVSVPGGPVKQASLRVARAHVGRIAHAYVKHALYWASKNRNYRATKAECSAGKYACPKCRANEETGLRPNLRPANYKRHDGQSHRLMGCPECLFLIKREDILGDPGYVDDVPTDPQAGWDGTMEQGFDTVRDVKAGHYWPQGEFRDLLAYQYAKWEDGFITTRARNAQMGEMVARSGWPKDKAKRVLQEFVSGSDLRAVESEALGFTPFGTTEAPLIPGDWAKRIRAGSA